MVLKVVYDWPMKCVREVWIKERSVEVLEVVQGFDGVLSTNECGGSLRCDWYKKVG